MSRGVNKAILVGNLGADPEVRSTSGGSRVATLSVATTRSWKNKQGEKQEKTEWHRVVAWNALADVAESYLHKGDKVYIEGGIEYRSWEDKDGQTRYTTEINARELVMLGGGSGGSGGNGAGGERPQQDRVRAAAEKGTGQGTRETFEDFPEALDADDDDLPF